MMGLNTSSETLSSGLSECNCLVVTLDWAGTRRVQAPTCRQNYTWLSRGSTASHHSCVCLDTSWVRAWTEKLVSTQQSTQEVLDYVAAGGSDKEILGIIRALQQTAEGKDLVCQEG